MSWNDKKLPGREDVAFEYAYTLLICVTGRGQVRFERSVCRKIMHLMLMWRERLLQENNPLQKRVLPENPETCRIYMQLSFDFSKLVRWQEMSGLRLWS